VTHRAWLHVAALAVLASGCSSGERHSAAPADIVLRHGGIYTVDAQRSWAQAMAIRDGEIVVMGKDADVEAYIGPATRIVDLTGHMALPGLHDSHVHPTRAGAMLLGCSLDGIEDVAALVAKVRDCAAQAQGEWVLGENYDLSLFPQGNADKSVLDAAIPDRPVYLHASDGHSGWANSRALALAGIDAHTPDPPKGIIERDPKTGEPSGTLRETANELVEAHIPKPTLEQNEASLRAALHAMAAVGITSFVDAWVGRDELDAYQALDRAGELTGRVRTCLCYGVNAKAQGEEWEAILRSLGDYESPLIDTRCIKLFLDGVLEGETAALLEPYLDGNGSRGELNFEPDVLNDVVSRFDGMGLQVHMHAIGDRAVRAGLDAVAEARRRNGVHDNRHTIAHLQLVDAADFPRFAQLDVTANFQALWAFPDEWITGINLPQVGQARVDRMYPIASILRAGGRIVGGSDWFVSSVNPLLAIETAITREDPTGRIAGVLNADERVDLKTMIDAYTINGAWLVQQEDRNGSLEVGKEGDVVVLDRNLFAIAPAQISDARVLLTIMNGKVIYDRAADGAG
jgi:predicted amidohydrolase YtcJ